MSDNVSGKALAAGSEKPSGKALAAGFGPFPHALFITWTTYGSWLPGDSRGWRNGNVANDHLNHYWKTGAGIG